MKLFAEITKIDREQRMVFGYASTETLDNQGEIVRKEAIEAALPDYMRFANIREMHQPSAVGVAKEAAIDDKGLYLAARIVDDEAWKKVTEGVYKGFSIGGKITARDTAAKHVITGVELMEISLVDRPANPEAVIELYKAAPAMDRSEAPRVVSKGMDGVRDLAGILADIAELQQESTSEEIAEADGSSMPARLRAWLDDGAALLRAMVGEETAELTEEQSPDPAVTLVGKIGARHSKADLARVQKLHDTAVELGAACGGTEKHETLGDVAKLLAERDATLRHSVDPLAKSIADLARRLAIVEAQPMPAKGRAKVIAVGKEQDAGGEPAENESLDGFITRLAGMSADKRAHELTKLALRFPRPLPR